MAKDNVIKSTVVIPNYNGISYIKNCLDSLLEEQKNTAFDIIVVDNHSTDGSIGSKRLFTGEGYCI